VHARVACHRGKLGYKEACFSLSLFTIGSFAFRSCLSSLLLYSSLPFDHFSLVRSFDKVLCPSRTPFISAIYNQLASIRI